VGAACAAGLGVAVALAAPAVSTGCQTHQCDSDQIDLSYDGGLDGEDLVPLVPDSGLVLWQSSQFTATNDNPAPAWLSFPGQMTYFFIFPKYFTPLQPPVAYVSTVQSPDPTGGPAFVLAGGQLAEINDVGAFAAFQYGFNITNATCAYYYLYVSVLGTYTPPDQPAPVDAGEETASDAAGDVAADTSGDAGAAD
jgi:hypothetical protein